MKKIYFLFIFASTCSFSQIINFPDINFKAKLLAADVTNTIAQNYSENNIKIDSNNNGDIEVSEVTNVFILNIPNSNISDLTGIESFSNLHYLDCSYNNLSHFNYIFQNYFYPIASHNQITSLSITGNMYAECDFSYNNIHTLTLNNVNGGGGSFNFDFNQITNISIIGSNYISHGFNLSNNLITEIDITNLSFSSGFLTLNLSNNPLHKIKSFENIVSTIYLNNLNTTYLDLTEYKDVYGGNGDYHSNIFTLSNCTSLTHIYTKNDFNFSLNCWQTTFEETICSSNFSLQIQNCPNLNYICVDEGEKTFIQNQINQQGLQNQVQVNSYCSFSPGGTVYNINGNTKFDSDNNGCSALDSNIPNQKFTITNGTETGTIIANNIGNYTIPVGAGSHTITPIVNNPTNFTVSPPNVLANFPTQSSPLIQNFCFTPTTLLHQFEISIVPITPAIPGFDTTYKIVFKNTGNVIENGSIEFNFNDTVLDFVSTTVLYQTLNVGNIYWNVTNLQPFETRTIDLVFNLNSPMETPALNAGAILNFNTFIANNLIPFTTVADTILNQTVVNSMDPNDKTCLLGNDINPSLIGDYVPYLIRFENTGTFPAQNIVVKDVIDITKFDISTLEPITGSHLFTTNIKNNVVEFIFENINLPFNDANNDGFVAFKIKSLPTLQTNDIITNQASIYFDYNFPIITNTATSTYRVLSAASFENSNLFKLFPVPSSNVLNITNSGIEAIISIEIYNTLGQLIQKEIGNRTQIEVSKLTSGNYFLNIKTETTQTTKQFIKE